MHDELDQPPVRVHQGMALAPLHLLSCIVAARTASLGRLGALAVDHRRRGTGCAADPLAVLHDQVVVDLLPGAVVAEPGEPAIHRQEWREAVRQHVPSSTWKPQNSKLLRMRKDTGNLRGRGTTPRPRAG